MIIYQITFLFLVAYAGLLLWAYLGWKKIPFFAPFNGFVPSTSITVIVPARNEANNILALIQCLKQQQYPKSLLHVIFINDHSTDTTEEIINTNLQDNWRLVNLKESKALNSYKKKAIADAIALADTELIITTDADCEMGPNWLKTIAEAYEKDKPLLISSPVVYHKQDTHFQYMQSTEFAYLIGFGAACMQHQSAGTCNGANLAYTREVFYEVGGFKGIDQLASGDDELLLHKIANKYPDRVVFLKSTEATVRTKAQEDLPAFIKQRRRWSSKSSKYKNKGLVFAVIGIFLCNVGFTYCFFNALFLQEYTIALGVFLLKFLPEFIFLYSVLNFFKAKTWLKYLPILTIIHPFYFCTVGLSGFMGGTYEWKGRLVQ